MIYLIRPTAPTDPTEYSVRCDVPGCDLEVPGPTQEEALDAAALLGFKFEKNGPRHACPECQKGTSPAAQAAKAQFQQQVAQMAQASAGYDEDESPLSGDKPTDPTGWLN